MSYTFDNIVTRGGDKGQTSCGIFGRVWKDAHPIVAVGAVDELQARIGVVRSMLEAKLSGRENRLRHQLEGVQVELYRGMGQLAGYPQEEPPKLNELERYTKQAMGWADAHKVQGFVTPGASPVNAHLHLARTGARTAEGAVVWLLQHIGSYLDQKQAADYVPDAAEWQAYLNRLSDYLFTLTLLYQ